MDAIIEVNLVVLSCVFIGVVIELVWPWPIQVLDVVFCAIYVRGVGFVG